MDLRKVDLNLLVIFDTLMQEKSVSKAAHKVHLSQPAVSSALSRLRDLMHDPVLVRGKRGMEPTPKALHLREPVHQILQTIDHTLFDGTTFNPATSERSFRVASTDYGGLILGTRLGQTLFKIAPSIQLNVTPLRQSTPSEALASGALDLAIGFCFDVRAGLYAKTLYHDDFTCLVRKDHPTIKRTVKLKHFLELDHILVSPWGDKSAVVDDKLRRMGLKRNVIMIVPNFLIAPLIISNTNFIVTIPRKVAEYACGFLPLKIVEPPFALSTFPVAIAWHERTHQDPAHQWLRSVIANLMKQSSPLQRKHRPVKRGQC